jgi:ABC-type phosphate transport system substrate-binding protein
MTAPPASATASVLGSGSSFAGPEILDWQAQTSIPPYNLNINYSSTSSGGGRFDFANETTSFGVTDIEYQNDDPKSPAFPYIYIPVTAGGLAFMYNLPGLSSTLQLSSYSACAIMTGQVTAWNDPVIAHDNPGVTLPDTPIKVVTRSDEAGTNFVLEQYCIDEQPALWASFVSSPGVAALGTCVSATAPCSTWPAFPGSIAENSSTSAANTVAAGSDVGYITAVETSYALQANLPVASMENASGDYTQPSAINVDSALAYATQLPNGTQQLNFNGQGPNVYNPSTYSYMLIPTTVGSNFSDADGAAVSAFVNYDLTIGQQPAPKGYAGLGLSLEEFGVDQVAKYVPGAVQLTSDETSHYASGDLTPAEVAAGDTTPTPPTNGPPPTAPVPASASTSTTIAGGTSTTVATGATTTTIAAKKVATATTIPKKSATLLTDDPKGFAAAYTHVVPASGGTAGAKVGGATVDVSAPPGAFTKATTVVLSSGPASGVTVPAMKSAHALLAAGVSFEVGGVPLAGKLAKPVAVRIGDPAITSTDQLVAYSPATKSWIPATSDASITHVAISAGSAIFEVGADPAVAIEVPAATTGTTAGTASTTTTPVTTSTGVTTTTSAPSATVTLGSTTTTIAASGASTTTIAPTTTSTSAAISSGKGLAFTGSNPIPLVIGGLVLMVGAESLRRRSLRTTRTKR